jgi:hypothetical protein
MAEASGVGGKSMRQVANDVIDGYTSINPIFLKKFDRALLKDLFEHLNKAMTGVRNLPVHFKDTVAMRQKNMKLQRLHNAIIIVRNHAREKRIPL